MSQSSVIAFFLLGGFIVYITIKGELPAYAAVVGIGAGATSPIQSAKQYGSGLLSGLESAITH